MNSRPTPSIALTSSTDTVVASSSVMLVRRVSVPSVAGVTRAGRLVLVRVTCTVSVPSTSASSKTGTVIVAVLVPSAMVTLVVVLL